MLKKHWEAWVLGDGVAFIAVAWLITDSPAYQECRVEYDEHHLQTTNETLNFSDEVVSFCRCQISAIDENEGFIVGFVTLVLAISTIGLWAQTGKLAEGAERQEILIRQQAQANIASNRAFVFPKPPTFFSHPTPTDGYVWTIHPQWENSGNTPTKKLELMSRCWLEETDLPSDYTFPAEEGSVLTILGPKATIEGLQIIIWASDLLKIQAGRKFFYLWGWAKYEDIFPGSSQHVTKYCYRVSFHGDPTVAFNEITNRVQLITDHHSHHNCADESCEPKKDEA
jgi:hypothetical protein